MTRYFEEYRCGCISDMTRRKSDLLGYCESHGEDRRYLWVEHKSKTHTEIEKRVEPPKEGE